MKIVCFSSFTFAYLNRARVLFKSLQRHQPGWKRVALITDMPPPGFEFRPDREPFDSIVYAQELEIERFRSWLYGHDVVEACTAVKGPFVQQACKGDADAVVYLDPDTCLFGPLDPIEGLLEKWDIILTPHLLAPQTERAAILDNEICPLNTGTFNLGFLAIRTTREGSRFAGWWGDRLREFCYDDMPNGLFIDQRWCNHVPAIFDNVLILRDPGYNVASWNLSDRKISIGRDGEITVNDAFPLRFWHFTKLGSSGDAMTKRYAKDNFQVYEIWKWYGASVREASDGSIPGDYWAYGVYENGVEIAKQHRIAYRSDERLWEHYPDPFLVGTGSYYESLFGGPSGGGRSGTGPAAELALRAGGDPALSTDAAVNGERGPRRGAGHLVDKADASPSRRYFELTGQNEIAAPDVERMRATVDLLPYRPTISILMPVHNTPERYLRAAIESVVAQVYPDWELCIADDASTDGRVRDVLSEFATRDPRVKVAFRAENGHIARASNSALELASGEFVALLDHDDILTADALYEVALLLNRDRDADMIYSDEDKVDEAGTLSDPFFKPDWCPESFMSRMYTCHLGVYRRALVQSIGGFRAGFEGSQDYDLVLRLSEKTSRIEHVRRILYHWRVHPASSSGLCSKPYAHSAARRALREALERRGEPGEVYEVGGVPGTYLVRYHLKEPPRVSVILTPCDEPADVSRCLSSVLENAAHPDLEIILVVGDAPNSGVVGPPAGCAQQDERLKTLWCAGNLSRMRNHGVAMSTGRYLVFLDSSTQVISADWLSAMAEYAQRGPIGAVGTLLLQPDDTVRHAGIFIAPSGVEEFSHRGYSADSPGYFHMLKSVNNCSAVSGACLMIRREVFEQVGGFDESLSDLPADIDLCQRTRAAGYRNVCLPHVALYVFRDGATTEDATAAARSVDDGAAVGRYRSADYRWDACHSQDLTSPGETIQMGIP